ncbi:MAG: RagB/SusD family nutrient uptake outer membrane protein [bacterium]
MKNHKLCFLMPVLLISLLFWSCSNLDENPSSQVTPENFFQTEGELVAAVIPVYASLRDFNWDWHHSQEVPSDEIVVPQRGGDWGDGGNWRVLQEHKWTPNHVQVNGVWNGAYRGIARANATLENLQQSPQSSTDLVQTFIAEVRVLRAFFYWWLADLYGGVPVVTDAITDPDNPPSQNTRQEVFDFIVKEITEALPGLKDSHSNSRVDKGAANALLATVYLNAEVLTGSAKWNECVQACDAIINSGLYSLMPNYKDVFALANEGAANPENIFVVEHRAEGGVGFNFNMRTLHYNQLATSPWNGFAVLADFYNKYDQDDDRFDVILVGQQFVLSGPNAGQPATDRQGNPLVFTVETPIVGATEANGPRILKWEVDQNASGGDSGNDYAFFRYSHILLAKAEALFMLGNSGEALALVNQVRARSFEPDKPLASIDLDAILDERGFEFLWEGFRRQDLIRHGRFLDAWTLKEASDGAHRKLFPIPQIQLDANPNLTQNPGY